MACIAARMAGRLSRMTMTAETMLEQLKAEMGARGESARALASAASMDYGTLRRYLSGPRQMPIAVLFSLLEALGLDAETFFKRAQERAGK